jgi:hypothetical protein
VPVIAIPLALGRTSASAVHPADAPTTHCRRTTRLPRPLRFGSASGSLVSLVHGVVAHFASDPPPFTGTASFCVGWMISMGLSVPAVSKLVTVSFLLSLTI